MVVEGSASDAGVPWFESCLDHFFLTDEDRFEFVLHFVTAKAETSLSRLAAAWAPANRESEGAAANRPAGRLTAR